jgi:hypothetical protein
MPWRVTSPMYQRQRFVLDAEHTPAAFTELCRRYGISRERVGASISAPSPGESRPGQEAREPGFAANRIEQGLDG